MTSEKTHDDWVVPNSDILYKLDVPWNIDDSVIDPTETELKMLEGTLSPEELLKKESEDIKKKESLSLEESRKILTNQFLQMFKFISLDEMNLHPFFNIKNLSKEQLEQYNTLMVKRVKEYDDGLEKEIKIKFYKICTDKLFCPCSDVSKFPIGL
jgi:hypothetical protein